MPSMSRTDRRRRLTAPFRARNYRAFVNTVLTYERPVDAINRYVRDRGNYPWTARVRTPIGVIELLVPHQHDVRTVNEVFARHDYGVGRPGVVADIGANIGVSAAYFLSRRPDSIVHAFEPHPGNLVTLRHNLARFGERAVIHPVALAPTAGQARFFAEGIGRYSGLAAYTGPHDPELEIEVECEAIGDALERIVAAEGGIDLLKLDTEGSEEALLDAIPPHVLERIGSTYYEGLGKVLHR
jgi:FkbM family methyltransferase